MKAVSVNSTTDYICKCDRGLPKEEQTVFKIRSLSVEQEAVLEDALGQVKQGGDFAVNLGSQALLALNLGLENVENLTGPKGKAVKMERDERKALLKGGVRPWKDESLSQIPRAERNEVAQFIINGGQLTETEAKN